MSCSNGVFDEGETDVDCGGGSCSPCPDGRKCESNRDCLSQTCDSVTHVCLKGSCDDGIKNNDETDADCGGASYNCRRCEDGLSCRRHADCASEFCDPTSLVCRHPSCNNRKQDEQETDVDCGGPLCGPCMNGASCATHGDCASKLCETNTQTCLLWNCANGIQDGKETDVDCGGPACLACGIARVCMADTDCASGFCDQSSTCRVPSCGNGVQDGSETDTDCGGGSCGPCEQGRSCSSDTDCSTTLCLDEVCSPQSCKNGRVDASETDVDCGGEWCPRCGIGKECREHSDCLSTFCNPITKTCSDQVDDSNSVVDCSNQRLSNADCASVAHGYTSCDQHLADNTCDDGGFRTDNGFLLNFNCDRFGCDNGACGACGATKGKRLGNVDIAAMQELEGHGASIGQLIGDLESLDNGYIVTFSGPQALINQVPLQELMQIDFSVLDDATLGLSFGFLNLIDWARLLEYHSPCSDDECAEEDYTSGQQTRSALFGFLDLRTVDKESVKVVGSADPEHLVVLEGFFVGGKKQRLGIQGNVRIAHLSVVLPGGLLDLSQAEEVYCEEGIVVLPGGSVDLGHGKVILTGSAEARLVVLGEMKKSTRASEDWWENQQTEATSSMPTLVDITNVVVMGNAVLEGDLQLSDRTVLSVLPGARARLSNGRILGKYARIANMGRLELDSSQLQIELVNRGLVVVEGSSVSKNAVKSSGLIMVEGKLSLYGQRNVILPPLPLFHPSHSIWNMYATVHYILRPKAFQVSFEPLKSNIALLCRGGITLAANAVIAVDNAHLAIVGLKHLTLAQSSTVVLTSSSALTVLPELGEEDGGEALHGTLDVQSGSSATVIASASLDVKGNLHVSQSSAWSVHYVAPTLLARRLGGAQMVPTLGSGRRLVSTFSGVVEISGSKTVTTAEVYLSNVYVTGELVITRSGSVEFREYAILSGKVENRGELSVVRGGHVLLAGAYEGPGGLRVERRGELIITADATIDGDVVNEGTLEIDVSGRSTIANYENNLFSTSTVAALPDCSSLGKRIRVFVQVQSSDDLQWSLPVHTCARMQVKEFFELLPTALGDGTLFTASGAALSKANTLADYGVGDRSTLTLEVVNAAVATLQLAGEANVGIRANGGTVSFNGDIEDDGAFNVFSDAYVSFSSESAVFSNGLDSSGEIWIEKDANVEINAMSESSGNFTNDGNLTIDDEMVFSDDVENSGSILITSSGNATFEAEFTNRGDIVIDDGGSMFLEGTSEFRSSGSVDSSGEIQFSSGSFTTLDGDFVNSGTTTVSGELEIDGDEIFFDGTFENTEEGSVSIEKGADVRFTSDLSSDSPAKFRVRSGGKARFQGTATFTGDGTGQAHVFNHGSWIVASSGVCSYMDDVFKVSGVVQVRGIVSCATSSAAQQGQILLQGDGEIDVDEDAQLNINPFCVFNAVDANARLLNAGSVKVSKGAEVELAGSATLKERSTMAVHGHGRFLKSSQVVSQGDLALSGDMTLDGNLTIGAKAHLSGNVKGTGHVQVTSRGELTSSGNVSYHGRLTTAPGSTSYMEGPTEFHEHLVVNQGKLRLGQHAASSFGNGIDSSGELTSDGGDFHCASLCSTGKTFESNGTVVVHKGASLEMHHVLAKRLTIEAGGACHITGKAIWQDSVRNNGTLLLAASASVLFVDGFTSAGRISNDGNATFLGKEVFFDGDYVGSGAVVVATGSHVHWHGTVFSSGHVSIERLGQLSVWSQVVVVEGEFANAGTVEVSPLSSVVFGSQAAVNRLHDDISSEGTLVNNGNVSFTSYAYISGQMTNNGDVLVRNGSNLVLGGLISSTGAVTCHGELVVTHAGQVEVEEGTLLISSHGSLEVLGSLVVAVDATAEVSGNLYVNEGSFTNDGICTLGAGAAVNGYLANSGVLTVSNMACLGNDQEKAVFTDNVDNFGSMVVRSCAVVAINGTMMMNGQLITSAGAEVTLGGDAMHRFVRDESVRMQVINIGTLVVDTDATLSVDVECLNLGEWDIYGVVEFMGAHRIAFQTLQATLPSLLPPSALLDAAALTDEDKGGMSVFRGGVLRGDVTLEGDVTSDGTVNPGILGREGIIVVNGSFHSTNIVRIDITSDEASLMAPKNDKLVVEGDARFTAGRIEMAMDKHYGTIKITPILGTRNRLALNPKVEVVATGMPGQQFHVEVIKTRTHHDRSGAIRDALKFRISSSLSVTAQTSRRRLVQRKSQHRLRNHTAAIKGAEVKWKIWLAGVSTGDVDQAGVERWAEQYIGGIPRVNGMEDVTTRPLSYVHVLALTDVGGVEIDLVSVMNDITEKEATCSVLPLVYLDLVQTLSDTLTPKPKAAAVLPITCVNGLFQCTTNGIGQANRGTSCAFDAEGVAGCVGVGYGGQGWCKTRTGERGGCSCKGVYLPAPAVNHPDDAQKLCLDTGEACATPCLFSKANNKLQCNGKSGYSCPCTIKPNAVGDQLMFTAWVRSSTLSEQDMAHFTDDMERFVGAAIHVNDVHVGSRPEGLSVYAELNALAGEGNDGFHIQGFIPCDRETCAALCVALNDTIGDLIQTVPTAWSGLGLTAEGCKLVAPSPSEPFAPVPCSTIGGGSAGEGDPCVTECSGAVLDGEQEWCFTAGYKWGYCSCGPLAASVGGDNERVHVGQPSTTCATNGFGEAPAEEPCAFPFYYRGLLHSSCLGSGFGGEGFCKTGSGLIGGCACRISAEPRFTQLPECVTNGIGTSPEGSLCAFPFSYKGVIVSECVGDGYGGAGWCYDANGNRGGCDCSRHSLLNEGPSAVCKTNGRGAVEAGLPCSFPFAHGGEIFMSCAGSGYGGGGFCYVDGRKAGCSCKESFASSKTYRCEELKNREDCEPSWCVWSDGRCAANEKTMAGGAFFVVGPEVVRTENDRVTIEVALNQPAKITAVALASGSPPPLAEDAAMMEDAYVKTVKQNLALSPVLITLDGLEGGTAYDVYLSAICVGEGSVPCFTDADMRANVLEAVRTESVSSNAQLLDQGMVILSVQTMRVEEGEWAAYTVVLDRAPRGSVMLKVAHDEGVQVSNDALVFHAGNWHVPQIVKFSVEDDHAVEADRVVVFTHSLRSSDERFNADEAAVLPVTVRDKDNAASSTMIVEPVRFESMQPEYIYSVVPKRKPHRSVSITVVPDPVHAVDASPQTLRFSDKDWTQPKQVRVVVNAEWRGDVTLRHETTSGDDFYRTGVVDNVLIALNSSAVRIWPVKLEVSTNHVLVQQGSSANYTLAFTNAVPLTSPVDVRIDVHGLEAKVVQVEPSVVRFSRHDIESVKTVRVFANAHLGSGRLVHTIESDDPVYSAIGPSAAAFTVTHADMYGVFASSKLVALAEGETASYTLRLSGPPAGEVVIALKSPSGMCLTSTGLDTQIRCSSNSVGCKCEVDTLVKVSPDRVVFSPSNWSTEVEIIIQALVDNVAEGAQSTVVSHRVESVVDDRFDNAAVYVGSGEDTVRLERNELNVRVADANTPSVVLSTAMLHVEEGSRVAETYTIALSSKPWAPVVVKITEDAGLRVQPRSVTFAPDAWNVPQSVSVRTRDNQDSTGLAKYFLKLSHRVESLDQAFDGLSSTLPVAVKEDDVAHVVMDTTRISLGKSSLYAQVKVVLTATPTAKVKVVFKSISQRVSVSPPAVVFAPEDWEIPRNVHVMPVDLDPASLSDTIVVRSSSSDCKYNDGVECCTAVDSDGSCLSLDTTRATKGNISVTGWKDAYTGVNEAALKVTRLDAGLLNVSLVTLLDGQAVDTRVTSAMFGVTPERFVLTEDKASQVVAVQRHDCSVDSFDSVDKATVVVSAGSIQVATVIHNEDCEPRRSTVPVARVRAFEDTPVVVELSGKLHLEEGSTEKLHVKLVSPEGPVELSLAASSGTCVESSAFVGLCGESRPCPEEQLQRCVGSTKLRTSTSSMVLSRDGPHGVMSVYAIPDRKVEEVVQIGDVVLSVVGEHKGRRVKVVREDGSVIAEDGVLRMTISDEDVAGVLITPNELIRMNSDSNMLAVQLTSSPFAPVTVSVSEVGGTSLDVIPREVVFDESNWNMPQLFTIHAIRTVPISGLRVLTASTDSEYSGLAYHLAVHIPLLTHAIDLSAETVLVEEGMDTEYRVRLGRRPRVPLSFGEEAVVLTPTVTPLPGLCAGTTTRQWCRENADCGATSACRVKARLRLSPERLVFSLKNWNVSQIVTVHAVDDSHYQGDRIETKITHAVQSFDPGFGKHDANLSVVVLQNDKPHLLLSHRHLVLKEGSTSSYAIKLASEPWDSVNVSIGLSTIVTTSVRYVVISPEDWDAWHDVDVYSVDNKESAQAGVVDAWISHTTRSKDPWYDGLASSNMVISVEDDEAPKLVFTNASSLQVREGVTASYQVALANSPQQPVEVKVTVAAGACVQGDAGPQYELLCASDADCLPFCAEKQCQREVRCVGPHAASVVTGARLTFNPQNWADGQEVRIATHDDHVAKPLRHRIKLLHEMDKQVVVAILPTIIDNDKPGLVLSETSLAMPSGSSSKVVYRIKLATKPVLPVRVNLGLANGRALRLHVDGAMCHEACSITFTPKSWDVDQLVEVDMNPSRENHMFRDAVIQHSVSSKDPMYANLRHGLPVTTAVSRDNVLVTSPRVVTLEENSSKVVPVSIRLGAVPHLGRCSRSKEPCTSDLDCERNAYMDEPRMPSSTCDVAAADTLTVIGVTLFNGHCIYGDGDARPEEICNSALDCKDRTAKCLRGTKARLVKNTNGDTHRLTFDQRKWNAPQKVLLQVEDDHVAEPKRHRTNLVFNVESSSDVSMVNSSIVVPVFIYDNDTPGVKVKVKSTNKIPAKIKCPGSYALSLTSFPSSIVSVYVHHDASTTVIAQGQAAEGAAPLRLEWLPEDWNKEVSVDVRSTGTAPALTVLSHSVVSTDESFNGIDVAPVWMEASAKDLAVGLGLSVSTEKLHVVAGRRSGFTVKLTFKPHAVVLVAVRVGAAHGSEATGDVQVSLEELLFTPDSWDIPRVIGVAANANASSVKTWIWLEASCSEGACALTEATKAVRVIVDRGVSLPNKNSEAIVLTTSTLLVSERSAGVARSYGVSLARQPSEDVDVKVYAKDGRCVGIVPQYSAAPCNSDEDCLEDEFCRRAVLVHVWPETLSFTRSNWGALQKVLVRAFDDDLVEASVHHAEIEHELSTAEGRASRILDVTVRDADMFGLVISPAMIVVHEGEGRASVRYSVTLRSRASGEVVVQIMNNPAHGLVFKPSRLVFPALGEPLEVQVQVSAVDNNTAMQSPRVAHIEHRVYSADELANRASKYLQVSRTDADVAGIKLSATELTLSEGDVQMQTVFVSLSSRPLENVTVRLEYPTGRCFGAWEKLCSKNDDCQQGNCSEAVHVLVGLSLVEFTPLDWNLPKGIR